MMVIGLTLAFPSIKLPVSLGSTFNAVGITTELVTLFTIGVQLNFTLFRKHARIITEQAS